jgi:hypothetical protein
MSGYPSKIHHVQGGDEIVVASGGKITVESGGAIEVAGVPITAETVALDGLTATAAEVNTYVISADVADGSADADYYVVAPHAGDIKKIWTVTDGAVGTADITVTASIAGTPVTGGAVTIATAGSAAGDIDSASPSAANTVTAGQAIKLAVAGGGSGGSPRIHVAIEIER